MNQNVSIAKDGAHIWFWQVKKVGALQIDLDLNIQKNRSLDLDFWIWMNWEGSEKNFTCQNHIWTTILVTDKF